MLKQNQQPSALNSRSIDLLEDRKLDQMICQGSCYICVTWHASYQLIVSRQHPVACSAYMEMSPLRFPFAKLNNVRALSVGGKEEGFSFLAPLSLLSVRTATGPTCSQQPPVFPATTSGSFMWRDSSKVAPYKWFSLARWRVSLQHVLEGASSATPVPSILCIMATSSVCNTLLQ